MHVALEAEDDLEQIATHDPGAAAHIAVALQEIRGSQAFLGDLVSHGATIETVSNQIGVKRIASAHRHKVPLWRLDCLDLQGLRLPYRVLYLFEQAHAPSWKPNIYIVAVAPRGKLNYDDPRNQYIARGYRIWQSL